MILSQEATSEQIRQQRREREAQRADEARRCKCKTMLRDRIYLGLWLCRLCQKLRYR